MDKKDLNINEDEKVIMSFYNENGEKVDFEAVARIYLNEVEYLFLAPLEGDERRYICF